MHSLNREVHEAMFLASESYSVATYEMNVAALEQSVMTTGMLAPFYERTCELGQDC